MPRRVARNHRDITEKSALDLAVGHTLRGLGIHLPRLVGVVPVELHQTAPRTLRPDRLYLLANGEFAHVEFQTKRVSRSDLDRFMEYDQLIWRRDHRPIHTVVIYGGRGTGSAPSLVAAGSITYRVKNVYLQRMDGDRVLAELERKVRAGRPLAAGDQLRLALCAQMRHPRGTLLQAARRAAALVRGVPNGQARQVCAWTVLALAAEVSASAEEMAELEGLMAVAGVTRLRDHLVASGRAQGKAEGRAEGKAEGRAEGKAEGRAEGKAEGRAEGKAEAIALVLRARYGAPPSDLCERIRRERRSDVLDRWLMLAGEAPTLEAFMHGLDATPARG
jgi:hypothetical protein